MIEITFGNAIAQAEQLENCADTMVQLSRTNLGNIKTDITAAWEGQSAGAYLSKLDLTADNIIRTANKLYEIAGTLRRVARIFRTSELKVLEVAEQRTFNS